MSEVSNNTPRVKILFCITKSNWGGAGRHVYDLATTFAEKNYDVSVLHGGSGLLNKKIGEREIKTIEISHMKRDISFINDFFSIISIIKAIWREKPDVLHSHSPKAGGLCGFVGRLMRVPKIVYTVHGWTYHEERSAIQKTLIYFFSWLTSILSHQVIVVSKNDLSAIKKMPFCTKKTTYIKNTITEPIFLPKEQSINFLENSLGIDLNNKFIIGTIAELHQNKGLGYAIEAISKIASNNKEFIYLIIGEGEKRKELTNKIQELGLQKQVFLVGFIENASKYLKAFDLFILPSIKEGLPYVILEASFAKMPIIATNVGGISDIIENKKSGLIIQSKDTKALIEAIDLIMNDKRLAQIMSEKGYMNVKENYSYSAMIDAVESIYK
jgi:glycosyltransferase involved in cell wall biosynthesis